MNFQIAFTDTTNYANNGGKYQNETAPSYYNSTTFPVEFYSSNSSSNMNAINPAEQYYNLSYNGSGSSTPYQLSSFPNQNYPNILNSSNVNNNGYNYSNDNYFEENNNGQNVNFIFNDSFPSSHQNSQQQTMPTETPSNELYEFLPEEIFQLDQPIVKSQSQAANQPNISDISNTSYVIGNQLNLSENPITYSTYNASPHTVLDLDSSGTIETNTKYLGESYFNDSVMNDSGNCCNDPNIIKSSKDNRNPGIENCSTYIIPSHCESAEINNNSHSHNTQMIMNNNNAFNDGSKMLHTERNMNIPESCLETNKKLYTAYENDLNKNLTRSQNLESIQSQIKNYQEKKIPYKKNPLLISCKTEDNYNNHNHSTMVIQYNGEFSPFRSSHVPFRNCQNPKSLQAIRSHQSKSISSDLMKDSNPQFQSYENFPLASPSYIYSKSLLNDNRIEEKYSSCIHNYMDV